MEIFEKNIINRNVRVKLVVINIQEDFGFYCLFLKEIYTRLLGKFVIVFQNLYHEKPINNDEICTGSVNIVRR